MEKVKKVSVFLIGVALAATAVTACGPSGKKVAATLSSQSTDGTSSGIGSGNPSAPADPLAAVDVDGYVDVMGSKHQIISLDKVNKTLIISAPLPENPLGAVGHVDLAELPGAYIEIGPDNSGEWELRLVVPLRYFKNVDLADPHALPNGDPLPSVPGGELPRIAAHIQNSKGELYLYLSSTIFAVFVPTPGINPTIGLTLPIKNRKKTKILGYLSTVPEKKPYPGGVFASFMIPLELARIIDDLF